MEKKSSLFAILIVSLCMIAVAMAVNIQHDQVDNMVTVHIPDANITAWKDENCTEPLEEIKWGEMTWGESNITSFYVKNEGSEAAYAEWHDDIENKIDDYADSHMDWYITGKAWISWHEESHGPTPTLASQSIQQNVIAQQSSGAGGEEFKKELNRSPQQGVWSPSEVFIPSQPIIGIGPRPLHLEPGEVTKVRYTIEVESGCPEDTYGWDLILGI